MHCGSSIKIISQILRNIKEHWFRDNKWFCSVDRLISWNLIFYARIIRTKCSDRVFLVCFWAHFSMRLVLNDLRASFSVVKSDLIIFTMITYFKISRFYDFCSPTNLLPVFIFRLMFVLSNYWLFFGFKISGSSFWNTLIRGNLGLQKIRNFGKFSNFLWPAFS